MLGLSFWMHKTQHRENPAGSTQVVGPRRQIERVMLIGLGSLSCLLLAILVLQLRGIWLHYQYYTTTGAENLPVYGIWKVQEGHPLYGWPNREFFQLTLYNFGFYHLYAGILSFFHARGPLIMLYGRYLTVAFALCGLFAQTRLLCFLTKEARSGMAGLAIWLVCFCTWFNSYFPGYFPVSVRPDIVAVAVSTLGLYCFIVYAATDKLRWVFAAATVWMLAWCLKQANVACIFGAGCYLLVSRKWSAACVLSLTFAIPVALILGFGSAGYRWNILVAPTVNSLNIYDGTVAFLTGLSRSLFTWTFVATLPVYLVRTLPDDPRHRFKALLEQMRPGGRLSPIMALAVVVLAGIVPSLLALSKTGSSLNQMYEMFVAATTLSFVLALRLASDMAAPDGRRFSLIIGVTLVSMCAFPTRQLATNLAGPIAYASDADMARKMEFSQFLKSLKAPVYIDDEIYSLPWYSNGNRYPAIIIDSVFYNDAEKRGMISGGVEKLISEHWFATLYIPVVSPYYKVAINANYQKQPLPVQFSRYIDSVGLESNPRVLLSAP
jgi:hypothetical protein